jgi:phosphoribosylformimino-5-aminoimidazole carboxamide ribotide isomerase
MEDMGVRILIFTDISRDGTLTGPNLEPLAALQQAVSCHIIASGGVRTLEDVRALAQMDLYGAICGKAVYKGTLSLKDAVAAAAKPAVAPTRSM